MAAGTAWSGLEWRQAQHGVDALTHFRSIVEEATRRSSGLMQEMDYNIQELRANAGDGL